ncbi:hypothetical protein [Nonomuraea diastatica]|uniref:Uncharacterized protein n=1 Tax=Nonomuraea diastatica TaxID=1848329 RepID=A0A4R4WZ63_9ACTN|nr:hypothetical protein [Nonomuraea diastatica]TDD23118.1 hypothetical protein E1294_09795 [Nonomuraea diastatica]
MSIGYGLPQLLMGSPWVGIGWDEAVYASQYAAHAPPAPFSAPRARGVPLLVAPVVAVTDSVPVLRLYLIALSSLGLCAAFAVWRGCPPASVGRWSAVTGWWWCTPTCGRPAAPPPGARSTCPAAGRHALPG